MRNVPSHSSYTVGVDISEPQVLEGWIIVRKYANFYCASIVLSPSHCCKVVLHESYSEGSSPDFGCPPFIVFYDLDRNRTLQNDTNFQLKGAYGILRKC